MQPPLTSESKTEWIAFVLTAIRSPGELLEAYAGRDPEVHLALIQIHRGISDDGVRQAFEEAVSDVLDNVLSTRAPLAVFALLQFVAYAKPVGAKQAVRRAVMHELLRGLKLGTYDLHGLALAVAGKYTIDDRLRQYVDRSAREASDIGYLLTCFRLRAVYDPAAATRMLLNLVGLAQTESQLQMIVRELRGFVSLEGCRPLLEWYISVDAVPRDQSTHLLAFEQIVIRQIIGANEVPRYDRDPYRQLFAAAILCKLRPLTPEEYVAIASVADVTDDEVCRYLTYVWKQQAQRGWRIYVLPPDDYENAEPRDRDSILIYNMSGRASLSCSDAPAATATLRQLEAAAKPTRMTTAV